MTATLSLDPTATAARTQAEFAALWPGTTLNLFRADVGFYKDWIVEPYRLGPDEVINHRTVPDATASLEIRGDMTEAQVRDVFYRAFGIEVCFDSEQIGTAETLDAASARLT